MNSFERYEYESTIDGFNDWALIRKPEGQQTTPCFFTTLQATIESG